MKKLLAVALALPLLASCATAPPASPAPEAARVAPATPADGTPAAAQTPIVTPTPTPDPTPTLGVRRWKDPETPPPLPQLTAEQQEKFGDCLETTVSNYSSGPCAKLVQQELKRLGFYTGEIRPRITLAGTQAIHRYQRSRDLKPTATVGQMTWYALASEKPARSTELPAECKLPGVVLCVDQGTQKLLYVKNGEVRKTVKVRTGGYASHPKTGKWRMFPTANGLFKVYNKNVNPYSENYGAGVMPYSVMFDPNMYVHYSSDFKRHSYNRASHGCVNVADLDDAKWIYRNTPIGSHVYVW